MTFTRSLLARLAVGTLAIAALVACGQPPPRDREPTLPILPVASPTTPTAHDDFAGWTEVEAQAAGDAAHGKALVEHYECNRCHAGTGQAAPMFERQCVGCHKAIAAGTLPFARERLEAWRSATRHYITTPTLASLGRTLRPSWVASFLHEPVKIRTHEEEWMPRLSIPESDARDIATFLTADAPPAREVIVAGDAARGAAVMARKGCFVCHDFTGATRADAPMEAPPLPAEKLAHAMTQAPDLRLARERFRPDVIARWIVDPSSIRPGTEMPTLGLTAEEARDAAAYILLTPLAGPPPADPPIVRLPVLERQVSYEEVAAKVFRKSCTHCHADPAGTGDPGPGSAGGFGFAPRGVVLLTYEGTQRGYLDEHRTRRSLFLDEPALASRGGSRLVAALVARHEETSGRPVTEVRGMPMGLPGLSLEDIQLVETWVSEGARR